MSRYYTKHITEDKVLFLRFLFLLSIDYVNKARAIHRKRKEPITIHNMKGSRIHRYWVLIIYKVPLRPYHHEPSPS